MSQQYQISGISVLFPCKPYPSQFSMMDKIIKGMDRRQNCLIESPTGSGKTLALLCSALAWQSAERVKQALIDTQESETAACNCSPDQKTLSCTAAAQSETAESQLTSDMSGSHQLDDDDDFKSVGSYIMPSSSATKVRKKYVSVMYESDQEMTTTNSNITSRNTRAGTSVEDTEETSNDKIACTCDKAERRPKPKIPKVYFGTRTHKQVGQIVRELKKTGYHDVRMTILASREHTCIHPQVSQSRNRTEACKELLKSHQASLPCPKCPCSSWNCHNKELLNDQGCSFKDCIGRMTSSTVVKSLGLATAWDLEDLVSICRVKRACPYFLSRGLKDEADLIICPYNYLVDPMVRAAMQISLKGHVVILDEAHNIEDSAREAASQSMTQENILKAIKDIESLIEANVSLADHSKLRSMLKNLDTLIDTSKGRLEQKDFDRSYRIWSGFHIVAQLETLGLGPRQLPVYKKSMTAVRSDADKSREESGKLVQGQSLLEMKPSTMTILEQILQVLDYLYRSDLKYVDDYRASLFQSHGYTPVTNNGQWLNSKSASGGRTNIQVDTYTLNFWCMNPGVAFSDFAETRSIILTSGTLSPLTSFESELGLEFKIQLEANHVIEDSQVWVGTLGQGPSGSVLQAVFRNQETFAFQDELGDLVLKVCQVVPHGVLCFLPSYSVLDKLMNRWQSTGLKERLEQHKMVVREPKNSDKLNFEDQLNLFYSAMRPQSGGLTNTGGAVLFAVCRGKVSEGLDFTDNFARAVITVGVPYPNFKDVQVELKRKYNDQHHQARGLLPGHEWYEIQAFRALNQALGRCIRHRNDWGALIIVDDRFVKTASKYCRGLSKWMRNKIQTFHNFSVAMGSLSKFTAGQLSCTERVDRTKRVDILRLTDTCHDNPLTDIYSQASSPNIDVGPCAPQISSVITTCGVSPDISRSHGQRNLQTFPIFNMKGSLRSRGRINSSRLPGSSNVVSCETGYRWSGQTFDQALSDMPGLKVGQAVVLSQVMSTQISREVLSGATDVTVSSGINLKTLEPGAHEPQESPRCGQLPDSGLRNLPQESPRFGQLPDSGLRNLPQESPRCGQLPDSGLRNLPQESPRCGQLPDSGLNLQTQATLTGQTCRTARCRSTETGNAARTSFSVSELGRPDWSQITTKPAHGRLDAAAVVLHREVALGSGQLLKSSPLGTNHKKRASEDAQPGVSVSDSEQMRSAPTRCVYVSAVNTSTGPNIRASLLESDPVSSLTVPVNTLPPPCHATTLPPPCHAITLPATTLPPPCHATTLPATIIPPPCHATTLPATTLPATTLPPPCHATTLPPPCHATTLPATTLPPPCHATILPPPCHATTLPPPCHATTLPATTLPPPCHATTLPDTTLSTPCKQPAKQIHSSKKFLFRRARSEARSTPVSGASCTPTAEMSPPLCLGTSPQTRCLVPSVDPHDDDGSAAEEDDLHVRRKMRGTKRKHLSNSLCKEGGRRSQQPEMRSQQPEMRSQQNTTKMIISCSVCGNTLISGLRQSEFQEQPSGPSFLRDTDCNHSWDTGSICFPASTDWGKSHVRRCLTGGDSKYVPHEEICVQFLYCDDCSQRSHQATETQPVGAEVKLAAGAGARFSKGQVWLFLSAVSQTEEQ